MGQVEGEGGGSSASAGPCSITRAGDLASALEPRRHAERIATLSIERRPRRSPCRPYRQARFPSRRGQPCDQAPDAETGDQQSNTPPSRRHSITSLATYVQSINEQSTGQVSVTTTVTGDYATPPLPSTIQVADASVFGPKETISSPVTATALFGTATLGTVYITGSNGNYLIINPRRAPRQPCRAGPCWPPTFRHSAHPAHGDFPELHHQQHHPDGDQPGRVFQQPADQAPAQECAPTHAGSARGDSVLCVSEYRRQLGEQPATVAAGHHFAHDDRIGSCRSTNPPSIVRSTSPTTGPRWRPADLQSHLAGERPGTSESAGRRFNSSSGSSTGSSTVRHLRPVRRAVDLVIGGLTIAAFESVVSSPVTTRDYSAFRLPTRLGQCS